ncbi:MAG: twin-arginine translocation signal domain-containing protein, partial [Verrucomicrobiales bacterium]|nr:twin-arginine translocation signal domain-containing protein [Verrucomicrobiales bacterium]
MSNKKQSSKSGETRRKFLKKTGTVAAAAAVLKIPVYAGNKAPSANVKGANEKIVVGYVGVGGRGFGAHVRQMRQNAEGNNIAQAAVCDVSTHRANNAKAFITRESKDKVEAYT